VAINQCESHAAMQRIIDKLDDDERDLLSQVMSYETWQARKSEVRRVDITHAVAEFAAIVSRASNASAHDIARATKMLSEDVEGYMPDAEKLLGLKMEILDDEIVVHLDDDVSVPVRLQKCNQCFNATGYSNLCDECKEYEAEHSQ